MGGVALPSPRCWKEAAVPRRRRPNVVLIGIDSLRADHMRCYGYPRLTTPHIDRFAREGSLFERTYSCGYSGDRAR